MRGRRCSTSVIRLLVYRQSSSAKPAIRVVTDGDLFTYDCGGTRAANCEALDDCAVVCIDRQRLHESARSSSLLTRVLRAVHSAELEMILESLGESRAGRAPRASENDDCSVVQNLRFRPPGASRATQRSFSENWSATVLRPDFSSRSNKSGVKS